MKSPLDMFFNLGNKITKGDPIRKLNWDYWMMWIMFTAFFTIFVDRAYSFYLTQSLSALGWSFVMIAILWFQYHGLKSMYEMRKSLNSQFKTKEKVDSEKKMMGEFK